MVLLLLRSSVVVVAVADVVRRPLLLLTAMVWPVDPARMMMRKAPSARHLPSQRPPSTRQRPAESPSLLLVVLRSRLTTMRMTTRMTRSPWSRMKSTMAASWILTTPTVTVAAVLAMDLSRTPVSHKAMATSPRPMKMRLGMRLRTMMRLNQASHLSECPWYIIPLPSSSRQHSNKPHSSGHRSRLATLALISSSLLLHQLPCTTSLHPRHSTRPLLQHHNGLFLFQLSRRSRFRFFNKFSNFSNIHPPHHLSISSLCSRSR
ncbi:hypothetical protein BDZ45DRAFT_280770 [Acephala macrosclerotiorum]|nr:hypothetical protein BDZ45DRAFT_280770 [Acephala macrosclerotiorum]